MKHFRNTIHAQPFRSLSNLPLSNNRLPALPHPSSKLAQSRLTLLRSSNNTAILTTKDLQNREKDKVTCSPTVAQKRTLKAQQKVELRNKVYFKPARSENTLPHV